MPASHRIRNESLLRTERKLSTFQQCVDMVTYGDGANEFVHSKLIIINHWIV